MALMGDGGSDLGDTFAICGSGPGIIPPGYCSVQHLTTHANTTKRKRPYEEINTPDIDGCDAGHARHRRPVLGEGR